MPKFLLAAATALALAAATAAQAPARLADPTPAESLFKPVGLSRELGVPEPPPAAAPAGGPAPGSPAGDFDVLPKFDLTYLPRRGGLGVTDLEAAAEVRLPFDPDLPPLKVVPGFAAHFWDGPRTAGPLGPAMPGATYDVYADFKWRPRPFEWLFVDLRLTPGWYTDGDNLSGDAFRLRGHALAMLCLSEQVQIVAGLVYTNRVRSIVVPAGGVRWVPDEDTELRLVFPAPRVARRVGTFAWHTIRVYAAGEFGGGSWAVRRAAGFDDLVEYSDLRAIAGVEAEGPGGRTWHAEVGYVFDRQLDYASTLPPSVHLGNTVMFRVGTTY